MTTITRELIAAYLNGEVKTLTNSEQKELAHIALASLDAGSDSNDHPAQGPLSNYRLHRISDILRKAAAQRDGGNIGYAMSDAVKAIDELLEVRKAEPVAYIRSAHKPDGFCFADGIHPTHRHQRLPLSTLQDGCYWKVTPLYAAPPAPVVPDECPVEIRDLMASHSDALFHDGDAQEIWNACRAAMLNHSGDVIEMREAIKQQSTMQPNNGAMSGDAVKQSSSNAQRR